VMTNGMSRVLFKIMDSLSKRSFAINRLDPICAIPITMKNMSETFLMLLRVSILENYT